jgi:arabinan endo-1,5-alpha-L-arabinosidase
MVASASRRVLHANPVYPGYFADPFAFRHGDVYYAIGTGKTETDGQPQSSVFPILRCSDFVNWEAAGSALIRPDPKLGNSFWAPAIAEHEGKFFLYYSVGFADKNHQLRVGISDTPLGPYVDTGKPLIELDGCAFAIDPHPFQDTDGKWYLAYAKDFLNCSTEARAGTALMLAPMRTMTDLQNEGVPLLRARSDWQRFEANRSMYGKSWDWHTLEGPCLWQHEGRYYCFYSGGRWENESYGVDYGVAEQVTGPYSDAGNEAGPRVLKTALGEWVGPGHNTIVKGPDNETDYIVYHSWDLQMTARRMCISPLEWTEAGPRAFLR